MGDDVPQTSNFMMGDLVPTFCDFNFTLSKHEGQAAGLPSGIFLLKASRMTRHQSRGAFCGYCHFLMMFPRLDTFRRAIGRIHS